VGQTSLDGVAALRALPGPRLPRTGSQGLDLVTHLLATVTAHPQPLVVHAMESFFAPHMGTIGCVGVRGAPAIREVLTNSSDYAPLLPDTGDLPPDVRSLSRGVFTFDGPPHARHRSALRRLIALDDESTEVMRAAAAEVIGTWHGRQLDLTTACRAASRDIWAAVLFGRGDLGRAIGRGVQAVVDGRRAGRLATTAGRRHAARRRIVHASRELTATLGDWLRSADRTGLLAGLGDDLDGDGDGTALAIAHTTALCAAATEPAAASLGWAVLALTQRPDLQEEIRGALDAPGARPAARVSGPRPPARDLLDRVLLESQRLLPSSAIVTRVTLRPVEVAGQVLPGNCEVMVSSLLAHREATRFPEPSRFAPERWVGIEVSPFEFFPFGAGVRGCLGAAVARTMLRTTLTELLTVATVQLAFDTRVGWQMPDALVTSPGAPVSVGPPVNTGLLPRALGPITGIVEFDQRDR
jgi:cytochrome P450